jgi:leucyl aminopeptidase
MCGAATVFATMKELDNKDLNINIVAALGLAENGIAGDGYKPSDILTAYNKKTVDIIHTDAE